MTSKTVTHHCIGCGRYEDREWLYPVRTNPQNGPYYMDSEGALYSTPMIHCDKCRLNMLPSVLIKPSGSIPAWK